MHDIPSANNPKRHHHITPRLYLKGFVEKKGDPFIWVYKKGEPYNPGQHKIKNNPFRGSIGNAGAKKDFYADPKDGGQKDFDRFENLLESFEKLANPVFEKIRAHQSITTEDKIIFSFYVVQMFRRVLRQREKVKSTLSDAIAAFEPSERLLRKLGLPETAESCAAIKKILEREAQKEGFDVKMHLRNIACAPESFLINVLRQMTWQFFVAPAGHAFLASDDPVFIDEHFGLQKNVSELSFPISSDVTLVAHWHEEQGEGFVNATPQVMKELNRRTASKASQHLYFSQNADWVVTLFDKSDYKFQPMYSVKRV